MLDPLLLRIICIGFALLFISASLYKFSDRTQFAGILKDYNVMSTRLIGPVAWAIPVIEIGLGAAWLMAGLPFIATSVVALISMVLLALYAFAIGLNLARGRQHIDCGCHFASSLHKAQNSTAIQILSPTLVLRNLFLVMVAAVTLVPSTSRELGFIDYFSLLAATLAVVLVFGAFNQLMANFSSINTWRKTHD